MPHARSLDHRGEGLQQKHEPDKSRISYERPRKLIPSRATPRLLCRGIGMWRNRDKYAWASLDSRFQQGQRAHVGVQLGEAADGQRGLVVDVADHEAGHSGHVEGKAALGQDVFEHPILHEGRRRLAAGELAEGHAGDAIEAAREPELGQESVDAVVRLVDASSRNRIAPRRSGANGVPVRCAIRQRFPPISRPRPCPIPAS